VVAAGLAIGLTGALWIDPVSSLVIVVVIAWTTWDLLRESLTLPLAGVPAKINAVAVSRYLQARDGVRSVHDLHIWPISTTDVAMTAHLVMPGGHPGDAFLQETAADWGIVSRSGTSRCKSRPVKPTVLWLRPTSCSRKWAIGGPAW